MADERSDTPLLEALAEQAERELAERTASPPAGVHCDVCNAPFEVADGEHVCGLTAAQAYSLGWRRGNNLAGPAASDGAREPAPLQILKNAMAAEGLLREENAKI